MITLFTFTFLDIYNTEYTISIFDSESEEQGEILTAKLYGQNGFILNYDKDNIDIVQGGVIKSDLTFSVVNENGILDDFLKNLQTYENRYFVDVIVEAKELIFWRGVMMNDFISFEDNKIQCVKFNCTDGLGLLQNVEYTDSIEKLSAETMQFDSDAYGNGFIDVISRAMSFNPVVKINRNIHGFIGEDAKQYFYYKTDYISEDMLSGWDALVYTNILKRRDDTSLMSSGFANYTLKDTLAGNKIRVYEYKSCYEVIDECLKIFNLCLCQVNGVWQIFNIRDFEKNKANFIRHYNIYNANPYYKNIRQSNYTMSSLNNFLYVGGSSANKRGSGEFGLNTVVKRVKQRYVPYYVKTGDFNNLLYSGNIGGELDWYSYPHDVIWDIVDGNTVYEPNFNNWNECCKYLYYNSFDFHTSMQKLQFLINFVLTYNLDAGSGYFHASNIKPKLDMNLNINGKWLDNNGNWVDDLPPSNWWHRFTAVLEGTDRVAKINFTKFFNLQIPNQQFGYIQIHLFFRAYTHVSLPPGYILPWNFKLTDVTNNSVLKLVDVNGNDLEGIDYVAENENGALSLDLEQAFIDNFSVSEDNNILFTATENLGSEVYRYKKSKRWKHSDDDTYANLTELRLREIAAMNNHPLLTLSGNIYYAENTNINYMLFYLIKYNLHLQNYVMFPQRWSFYARKCYATVDLIEVSKDWITVQSGGDLVIGKHNVPLPTIPPGHAVEGEGIQVVAANIIRINSSNETTDIATINKKNGEVDFTTKYDEDTCEITLKKDDETLLTIDNEGLHYKNYLRDSVCIFLQKAGLEKVIISGYNLLENITETLSSAFFVFNYNKITVDLSSLDNYENLVARIDETVDINYEFNDLVFLAQGQNINVYNFTNNNTVSYIERDFNVGKLYFCKERNYYNVDSDYFNLLFYIDIDNNYIISTIDNTWIQATCYIIYNNLLIYHYASYIYSKDLDGNTTQEANYQIDGFFIYMNTLYAYNKNDNITYKRENNGSWAVYDSSRCIRNKIHLIGYGAEAFGDIIDICVYKDKIYGIKNDGLYVYINNAWLLVSNDFADLTKMQATEKYIYMLDNGYLRYFDGNFIYDTQQECTDFVAVETKDCMLKINNTDNDIDFNSHLSNIQELQHNAQYHYYIYSPNYEVFNLNIKNMTIKNEIKKIENT